MDSSYNQSMYGSRGPRLTNIEIKIHSPDEEKDAGLFKTLIQCNQDNYAANDKNEFKNSAKNISEVNSHVVDNLQESNHESIDSLIPRAARLILAQQSDGKNESSDVEEEFFDNDMDGNLSLTETSDSFPLDDYQMPNYVDQGLEVIHEETESQISSDTDFDLDRYDEICSETLLQRKPNPNDHSDQFWIDHFVKKESPRNSESLHEVSDDEFTQSKKTPSGDEIISKHIRISSNWNPDSMLKRLYAIPEPPKEGKKDAKELMAGYMLILSGNRKKGTFWNAWKRKFFIVTADKLISYDNDSCQELVENVSIRGGSVDFLDPKEFVRTEKDKNLTNRIIGVDDGKGHYFVLQCATVGEAEVWIESLEKAVSSKLTFSAPLLVKEPSLYRDILLVDFGSTNIRSGVLTYQAILPSLFFASVMSENPEKGITLYGNDVYLPQNRKNAKIRFPFECSSKISQNTIDVNALEGFFLKILKELNLNAENFRIFFNFPRRIDNNCRKSILKLLFHKYKVRSVLLAHQSVMAFWAYSVENGIICDVGERCDIVPVSQGFVLNYAWSSAPLGGHPLKHSLRGLLGPQENGLYLSTPAENLVLRFISENFTCVNGAGPSRRSSQDSQEIVVEMDLRDVLPFSGLIGVNQEVLRSVAEGFFHPSFYGLDCSGIPKLLLKALQSISVDLRKEISQNIILVGGSTLIPGFVERLQGELTKLCPPHMKPKILASPYRYHASFIGASVLANTDSFEKSVLHRAKYDDGPGPTHWLI